MTKKKNSRKKTTAKTAKKQMIDSEVKDWVGVVIILAITVVAYMQMGVVGVYMSRLCRFLFGKFYYVILGVIVVQILITMINRKDGNTRSKNPIAVVFIVLAVLLMCAYTDTSKDLSGGEVISEYLRNAGSFFSDEPAMEPGGGIIGALLFSLTSAMVDRTGTVLIIVVLFIIAALLLVNLQVYKQAFRSVWTYLSTRDEPDEDADEEEEEEPEEDEDDVIFEEVPFEPEMIEPVKDLPPREEQPKIHMIEADEATSAIPVQPIPQDEFDDTPEPISGFAEEKPAFTPGSRMGILADGEITSEDKAHGLTEEFEVVHEPEPDQDKESLNAAAHTKFMTVDDLYDSTVRPLPDPSAESVPSIEPDTEEAESEAHAYTAYAQVKTRPITAYPEEMVRTRPLRPEHLRPLGTYPEMPRTTASMPQTERPVTGSVYQEPSVYRGQPAYNAPQENHEPADARGETANETLSRPVLSNYERPRHARNYKEDVREYREQNGYIRSKEYPNQTPMHTMPAYPESESYVRPVSELPQEPVPEQGGYSEPSRFSEQKGFVEQPEDTTVYAKPEPVSAAASPAKPRRANKPYHLPKLTLLDPIPPKPKDDLNEQAAKEKGGLLIQALRNFDIEARLIETHIGPSVTKFEIRPDANVKVSRILGLADDIKMQLAVRDVRIEAPIPGRNAVGVEIPNQKATPVKMKELFNNLPDGEQEPLLIVLGKDLLGKTITCRLDKMPHLMIAGATGSGKSVCMNSIITSILLRTKPDDVKMLLVDPKKVEFTPYQRVPHLIGPVINDPTQANNALKVIVKIMDERYDAFAKAGVRNIQGFNKMVSEQPPVNEDGSPAPKKMPYIVVIVDEMADLMNVAGKEVESSIQRITQLARAAGIHLIIATQRPSTDVITGVIKANIPSRIAFAVSSGIDSRTILDHVGAERLLGNGDMLYLPIGVSSPTRVQGVFITDDEVKRITDFVSAEAVPMYDDSFVRLEGVNDGEGSVGGIAGASEDPLFEEVREYVIDVQKASTSLLQRRFGIGYNRAARMIDLLEEKGVIGPAQGSKPREVYIKKEE